ncbi:hypothetical protein IWQ60_000435 [Tieghemiomyces parasiticus]|uniref:Uncharacterized protein n=1 Tax=Tieghemiomyces parasiticus TaxID=78921 RepID=A0A9W8AIY3_9FUNG|nr:hypothetical protein IWQ60_000435 [Tieghemiomyces parasiticus]
MRPALPVLRRLALGSGTILSRSLATTPRRTSHFLPRETKVKYKSVDDPYLLSAKIDRIIKLHKLSDAIALAMTAPQRAQSTVVWNRLITACASMGALNRALKLYNQLKRRGLSPDPQTYTALLNVCAGSDSPRAVSEAEKIFEHLKERFPPGIIHINTLLKVYAETGHFDRMTEMYKQLPPSGNNAPDNITYTIVIQALLNRYKFESRPAATAETPEKGSEELRPEASSRKTATAERKPAKQNKALPSDLTPGKCFEDAFAVWTELIEDQRRRSILNQHNTVQTAPIRLDAPLVNALLLAASRSANPNHAKCGLQVLQDAYGFSSSVVGPLPAYATETARLQPMRLQAKESRGGGGTKVKEEEEDDDSAPVFDSQTFNRMLTLCLNAKSFRRGLSFAHQAREKFPENKPSLSNLFMVSEVMRKYTAQVFGLPGQSRK